MEHIKKYRYLLYLVMLFVLPFGLKWIYQKYIVHLYVEENRVFSVPETHTSLFTDERGRLFYLDDKGVQYREAVYAPRFDFKHLCGNPQGSKTGLLFDFGEVRFNGKLDFGLSPFPAAFTAQTEIRAGKAEIDIIEEFSGSNDIVGWQRSGRFKIAYRAINNKGEIVFDGHVNVSGFGPFKTITSLLYGPAIQSVSSDSAIVRFTTNKACKAHISINGQKFLGSATESELHEIVLRGLYADSLYEYSITYDNITETYSFRTFPLAGDDKAFVFAFAGNSFGQGGGERDVYGVNQYYLRRVAALARRADVRFFQFGGGMISGPTPQPSETKEMYRNWKRALHPYSASVPFYTAMGKGEVVSRQIQSEKEMLVFDRFPYNSESGEAVFASEFSNPLNGPVSEVYGGNRESAENLNFPSYSQNVYSYRYGNTAMIVLNTNYWNNANHESIEKLGGNPQSYIMDEQLLWLQTSIQQMESDSTVRHIFITLSSPLFPLSSKSECTMLYSKGDVIAPVIAGKRVENSLLERRDEILDIIINQSSKTRAILCAYEQIYARLKLSDDLPLYDSGRNMGKPAFNREVWQITNGSAASGSTTAGDYPWSAFVERFETQSALCLFYINGDEIVLETINPETLEIIEKIKLKHNR